MSLYNMIHGENPFASVLLAVLGLRRDGVPRYRDCYWTGTEIAVYTRTGGGNRDYYENAAGCRDNYPEYFEEGNDPPSGPWNDDLRALPTFQRDEDDDYDCTYATFYFGVPEPMAWVIPHLSAEDKEPAQKWQEFMDKMRDPAKSEDAQVQRAVKAMEPLFAQLTEALNKTPNSALSGSDAAGGRSA